MIKTMMVGTISHSRTSVLFVENTGRAMNVESSFSPP